MIKTERFTFLCDSNDRRAISTLAELLRRSQSDAVRWIVNQAARELGAARTDADALNVTTPARTECVATQMEATT